MKKVSKENQAKEESLAKMENLVSLVGMVYLVGLELMVLQEEMVKRVKKVTLVLPVPLEVSFQDQALMQQWDQKVAKDCQDSQEPKGSVDSLVGQAHLACRVLQGSLLLVLLAHLAYLVREDRREIQVYPVFPFLDSLDLMDHGDLQDFQVLRDHLHHLFLLVKGYVNRGHQVLQEFQDNKALQGSEAKKVIKETHASIV